MSQDRLNRIDVRLGQLESTQRVHAASLNELAKAHDRLRRYDAATDRAGANAFLGKDHQDDIREFVRVISEGLDEATKRLSKVEWRMIYVVQQMELLEGRVDTLEQRSDAIMARLDRMERWPNRLDKWNLDHGVRVDQLEQRLGEMESRIEQLDLRMQRLDNTLQTIVKNRTH